MRIPNRSVLGAGKSSMAFLLAMVPVMTVIVGSDAAFSQSMLRPVPPYVAIDLNPSGSCTSASFGISSGQQIGASNPPGLDQVEPEGPAHALLWRGNATGVVDLHPRGFTDSEALGISGEYQVGFGSGPTTGGETHALLWRGTAASVVDLHPGGFVRSRANGTSGKEQAGSGFTAGRLHALLWRGTAASMVDLHPSDFTESQVLGASRGQQVGSGFGPAPRRRHALLWRGSAGSVVDLHPNGFTDSEASGTSGEEQAGYGYGPLTGTYHALLWRGSAGSVVDLHSYGFEASYAVAASGSQQVGYGHSIQANARHALVWRSSAISAVDLHNFLPSETFSHSWATGIDASGDIVGFAFGFPNGKRAIHAFLWKRNGTAIAPIRGQGTLSCRS